MFGTRVPGRAVPWGPGRLPWAPGAPPRGFQWRGPGPKLQGPIPTTSTCRPFEFVSNFMSIVISICDLLGLDLGNVGAFCGPSWSRNRLRTDLSSKTQLFTNHHRFQWFLLNMDPKMGPRSSWIAFLFTLIFRFDL